MAGLMNQGGDFGSGCSAWPSGTGLFGFDPTGAGPRATWPATVFPWAFAHSSRGKTAAAGGPSPCCGAAFGGLRAGPFAPVPWIAIEAAIGAAR